MITLYEDNRKTIETKKYKDLELEVEFPIGFINSGVNKHTGNKWENLYDIASYGYIVDMYGTDGDNLDFYLAKSPSDKCKIYVAHLLSMDGKKFEQDKSFIGFNSWEDAKKVLFKYTYKCSDRFLGYTEMDYSDFILVGYMTNAANTILADESMVKKLRQLKLLPKNILSPVETAKKIK